jgi:hypothetical protein
MCDRTSQRQAPGSLAYAWITCVRWPCSCPHAGRAAAAGPKDEVRRARRAAGSGSVGGARSAPLEGVEKVSTTQDMWRLIGPLACVDGRRQTHCVDSARGHRSTRSLCGTQNGYIRWCCRGVGSTSARTTQTSANCLGPAATGAARGRWGRSAFRRRPHQTPAGTARDSHL